MILSEIVVPFPYLKQELPNTGGVYMFLAGERILYIGRTWRFDQRIKAHDKIYDAKQMGLSHIKFITIEDRNSNPNGFTANLERELIKQHNPPLNGHYRRSI